MAEKKAPAKKTQPAKATATAKKTEPVKTTATAKKTEPAKSTTAKKPEPAKTTATAKKPEPAKTTATAKKPEPAKATATAKKPEPAKATATAKKPEPAKATATAKKPEPAKTEPTKKAEPVKTAEKKAEPVKKVEPTKTAEKKAELVKKAEPVKTAEKKAEPTKKVEPTKTKAFSGRAPKTEASATLVADRKHKADRPRPTAKEVWQSITAESTMPEPNMKRVIAIVVLSVFVVLTVLILALSLRSCALDKTPYVNAYKNVTQVGMSSEVLGKVNRYKPVEGVTDGGLVDNGTIPNYPKWGHTTAYTDAQKNAILAENRSLCGRLTTNTGGVYTYMDENGYIFDGTRSDPVPLYDANGKQRQLYQHTGSVDLYMGNVSDDEQAVVKTFTFRKRSYSSYYDATGLYAPAGELIKIQLTDEDMTNTGGIVIHIGQALYNGQCNNIWAARNFNRMPIILNTMAVTKDTAEYDEKTGLWTAYVGSFVGGPIYVRDENCIFNVTISGGVNYAHFILGVTTEEEYNEYAKSSVPYFDLEVWDSGVLHSGPYAYAKSFSYDELYKAAILWEKVSLVSSRVVNQGIVFIYDCFVAAGAAVAFPGRRSVNCPGGWMTSSLNYASIVASGSWGNFHEYHHNFQNYGVGYTGEVTNNGLNLVSYSLFTKISSARGVSSYGAAGLSGWNTYTSATWVLERCNLGGSYINSTNGLATYGVLLHNFGQDAYITCTGATGTNWYTKWANYTHQDFSYFTYLIQGYAGGITATVENDYSLFVPVASVYQTGRRYYVDGEDKEFQSMQPYVIPYGEDFTVDLRPYTEEGGQYRYGSIIIGKDFSYKIKSVKTDKGFNGTLTKTDEEDVYTFKPNKEMLSGKIYVTLEITQNANSTFSTNKTVDDVELVLQFEQSHESKKTTLERTTYEYGAAAGYTDAVEAYNKNFAGYSDVVSRDHANPTQNANTDIWYIPPANLSKFPNAQDWQTIDATTNKVDVVDGKLYFAEDGIYRIYLRGRVNCALYYSMDGKSYALGATVTSGSGSGFYTTNPETYFDVQFVTKEDGSSYTMTVYQDYSNSKTGTSKELTGDRWLYIKEVLITKMYGGTASYIGVGIKEWDEEVYTVRYYYSNGQQVPDSEIENADPNTLTTKYFNSSGLEVSAAEAESHAPKAPTGNPNYANAYRRDYEFQKEFTSDYYYTRSYNYNYNDTTIASNANAKVVSAMSNGQNVVGGTNLGIEHICDNNTSTAFHIESVNAYKVTAANPFELIVDLGEVITANYVIFYCYNTLITNNVQNNGMPKAFTLYGSEDGSNYSVLYTTDGKSEEEIGLTSGNMTFKFDRIAKFRYYKLFVTDTASINHWIALKEIQFYYNTTTLTGNGNNHISLDSDIFSFTGKWTTKSTFSCFGHVYIGQKNSQATFSFEGTRFMILSSSSYGRNFEVYIDGKKVASEPYKAGSNPYITSYLSPRLSNGKHTVQIKCTGQANIDSIATYTETD